MPKKIKRSTRQKAEEIVIFANSAATPADAKEPAKMALSNQREANLDSSWGQQRIKGGAVEIDWTELEPLDASIALVPSVVTVVGHSVVGVGRGARVSGINELKLSALVKLLVDLV